MQAGMGGIGPITLARLAAAISEAGALGTLAQPALVLEEGGGEQDGVEEQVEAVVAQVRAGIKLAVSLTDKPLAINVPNFDLAHLESPCPYTLLGTKAVGEGGSLTSLAAIANSIEDALTPFGVKITSLPITPEKVYRAIHDTKQI